LSGPRTFAMHVILCQKARNMVVLGAFQVVRSIKLSNILKYIFGSVIESLETLSTCARNAIMLEDYELGHLRTFFCRTRLKCGSFASQLHLAGGQMQPTRLLRILMLASVTHLHFPLQTIRKEVRKNPLRLRIPLLWVSLYRKPHTPEKCVCAHGTL
jgi:hypothetical protein